MIFTLYYMYATLVQWWRLGLLKNKLNGTLNPKNALLVCDESVIFDTKKQKSFENLLFRNGNRIGCTVVPKQIINLSSQWVTFPKDSKYFPIYFKENKGVLGSPSVYIFLQTVLEVYQQHEAEILQMENYGELVAWKATDHFEAILKSDMANLTKLVHCFSQSDCDINHELQLLKIETVEIEGKAKKIKYDRKFRKESTIKYSLAPVHWRMFVYDVKQLYSKIRDATNPKITIDNGTPKPEDLKKVPVSEVKPIKKDKKGEEKYTLDVNSSDYRRHKVSEHGRKDKDKDKSSDRHKTEKVGKKDLGKSEISAKEEGHKVKEHKKYKSKEEIDGTYQKNGKIEIKEDFETDMLHKREREATKEREHGRKTEEREHGGKEGLEIKLVHKSIDPSKKVKQTDREHKKEHKIHKPEKKHRKTSEETEPSTSKEEKPKPTPSEKLNQSSRTSSKDKKLVRSSATCDETIETENTHDMSIENGKLTKTNYSTNGSSSAVVDDEIVTTPSELNCHLVDKNMLRKVKPPNILVYADSKVDKENVTSVLGSVLNRDKYIIYDLPSTGRTTWSNSTVLVVVCGSVDPKLTFNLMKYLVNGGQLLCLCSDLLYSVLHTFTTAEVREHELVRFSYGKWKNVKMMHHIFCYQASPAKKQFSKDSDNASNHSSSGNGSSPVAPRTPSTVDIQHNGKDYTIQVQVLGAEETWQTPSLLLATVKGSEGRAVFSQVHLEINPDQYETDESKFEALRDSDQARMEILRDILSNHLDLDCDGPNETVDFTPGYFLGRHDLKLKMISDCPNIRNNKLAAGDLQVAFCGKDDKFDGPGRAYLPVLIHACPTNFSTLSFFETLETTSIGRLVIYSDVLQSSHSIVNTGTLTHGLAIICRQQVNGMGRSNNSWISPLGGALFSLQIHIPVNSPLGKVLPVIQHLMMVAVVSAIKKLTQNNKNVKVGIKWPNDLYANGCVKIGGVIVTTTMFEDTAIVNIGCGVNLSNSNPTTCVNDIIKETNLKTGSAIPEIPHEKFFATVFNETEKLIKAFQNGDVDSFYDIYYEYWLHNDSNVVITSNEGKSEKVKIVGIDDYGFLRIRLADGKVETVQSDGNSFDLLKGLIYPKEL